MQNYIYRRLLLLIPTMVLITIIVFFLVRFIPGSVIDVMLNEQESLSIHTPLARAELMHKLGLDVPIYVQYWRWVGSVLHGDLGQALWSNQPVLNEVLARLPVSIELGLLAIIIGQAVAIPIGVFSAIRQDTPNDYLGRSLSILFLCLPNFWLGTLIVVYPSLWWYWAPSTIYIPFARDPLGNLGMFIIPATIMGLNASGTTMRMMRTTMLDVLRLDYVRTAWSKGLSERMVITRHCLKNALIPVVTMIGLQIPILIGGTVIMEQIFCLPGMGRLAVEALTRRDYPMVSGINLFFAVGVMFTNLAVDLSYGFLDPRIRYQ